MKSLSLVQTINRENLLAVAKEVPGARVGLKIAALLLVLEGQRPGRINSLFGLNHMALERCIHTVNQEGPLGLVPKQHTGRPTRLTPDAQQRLEKDLRMNPQEFGLSRPGWDGPTLVLHLKEHFGIRVEVRQAERWMHKLGYSLKRASYAYIQARAEDAHRFGEELKKLNSLKSDETVVFEDETGFTLHPRLGRGWAKKGQRLRVPTKSQHRERLNLFGWVAPLLGKKGMIRTGAGNTLGFLEALKHMLHKLRNYHVWLYVDRAPWHKGEDVELFVQSHTELTLEYLPPYQPALNPQERIWRQTRYEITRNVWFNDLDSIYASIINRVHYWSPKKIKNLCNIN